jgi:CRP-like cAMP-binding protein
MNTQASETEKKLLASGIEISYLPGEYLFRSGQKAEFVFYVLNGKICLETTDDKEYVLEDQSIFLGIDELMNQKKHSFSTHTITNSKFLVYEKKYFLSLIQEFGLATNYFEDKLNELTHFFQTTNPKLIENE